MGFIVPTGRENIGNPLDKYSINHDVVTVIKLRKIVKWAKIREGCCVVCTIVWNKNYLQYYWNNNNMTRNI